MNLFSRWIDAIRRSSAPAPAPSMPPAETGPGAPPAPIGGFRVPESICRARGVPPAHTWRLTPGGLVIDGAAPIGTPGEPVTIRTTLAWFGPELRMACAEFGVPLELALACAATEATGLVIARKGTRDQARCARRAEPGYLSDQRTPSRVSVGIMQTLLSTASETLGRPISAVALEDPAISARAGVAYMARQAPATEFDPPRVAAAYNAGSVRPEKAAGNPWRMVCYPSGTGKHITRFVAFFNDSVRVLRADPALAGQAPAFATAIWPRGQMG